MRPSPIYAPRYSKMLDLPLQLILLCLLVLNTRVEGQQCRLVMPSHTRAASGGSHSTTTSLPSSTATPGTTSGGNVTSTQTAFAYGKQPVRGVNLGGWFVLEPWITPSIFQNTNNDDIIDEYTFGQMQDYNTALGVLTNHWQSWITEADFITMQNAGLNHVRIPIGYWSIPLTSSDTNQTTSVGPYIPGAWPFFLQALTWAQSHSINVIVDLHGAPGSQNGFDNSGQRTNNPVWGSNPANVSRTLDIIRFLAKNVGDRVAVIELLNEPAGFTSGEFADAVRGYWSDGYDAVRSEAGGAVKVMIGDAFLGVSDWQDFLTYPSAQGVIMDYHEYQIFSNAELSRSLDEHISFACTIGNNLTSFASGNLYTILGEWSNAPTDCAQWLNGRGVGARWDGTWWNNNQYFGSCSNWTGSASGFSNDYKTFLRKYWEVQVDIGESVEGWIFWTWKAENADEWSYEVGLQEGWIPQDPSQRMYPGICSS